jgi:hypothetical protein
MNARLFVLTFFWLLSVARTFASDVPGADIFATNAPVLRIQIEIGRNEIHSLQNDARKPVPATLREGTNVYPNVFVHIKGSAGSMRSINDNPALTVAFGKKIPTSAFTASAKFISTIPCRTAASPPKTSSAKCSATPASPRRAPPTPDSN